MKSVININYVESRDGGTYECRASNPFGVATYSINLNILGKFIYFLYLFRSFLCLIESNTELLLSIKITKCNISIRFTKLCKYFITIMDVVLYYFGPIGIKITNTEYTRVLLGCLVNKRKSRKDKVETLLV